MINTLFQNPLLFILIASSLILCLSIHEFAHAYMADKLGDDTARLLGRLTLNPRAHLDPIGTLMLLFAGFGWGKPVPFNPYNLKNPKRDSALIALAGPVSNFILAIILSIILKVLLYLPIPVLIQSFINSFLFLTIFYNLILGLFNLIPVHPLDGFKIVNGLLPEHLSIQWLQMAPYGIYILLLLVFTNTTDKIISPLLSLTLGILGVGL